MNYKQKQHLLAFFGLYDGAFDGLWGPKSMEATKQLQRRLGLDADGIFGTATIAVVQALIGSGATELPGAQIPAAPAQRPGWWNEIKYFSPDEFACKCGNYHAPYCDGWPHEMLEQVVRICDRCREHFGVPITIVSGLRCERHNSDSNGVKNSQHMFGEAVDIYVWGISGDVVCAWLASQSDVRYTYKIDGTNNVHFDIPKQNR